MTMSERAASRLAISSPLGVRTLRVMPRLLTLVSANCPGAFGPGSTPGGMTIRLLRRISKFSGHSILMISAPNAPNQRVAHGPARTQVKSSTRTPVSERGKVICFSLLRRWFSHLLTRPALLHHVKALRLWWFSPQGLGTTHGHSALRTGAPGIVDVIRRPGHQGSNFGGVAPRDERLAANKTRRFALCFAIAIEQLPGLADFVGLGPVMRQYTDHCASCALAVTPFLGRFDSLTPRPGPFSSRFSPRLPGPSTPSPLAGEGRDGEGGKKHGLGTPPAFTPTLTLPRRGGGKRLTGRVGSGQYLGRAWDPTGAWHE